MGALTAILRNDVTPGRKDPWHTVPHVAALFTSSGLSACESLYPPLPARLAMATTPPPNSDVGASPVSPLVLVGPVTQWVAGEAPLARQCTGTTTSGLGAVVVSLDVVVQARLLSRPSPLT